MAYIYNAYESTNVAYINLKFVARGSDPDDTNAKCVVWNSKENPQWVVSMSHSINGNGAANDLSLELHHHIDPYINTPYGSIYNATGLDNDILSDDPGFLLNLINDSYNTIYFNYGYAQTADAPTSDLNVDNTDNNGSIKIDDDTWFRMYITEVTNTYDTAGITVHITAVSSLVTPEALFGEGTAYDWLADPESRIPHTNTAGFGYVLRQIIRYFAKQNNYDVKISDMYLGSDAAYLKAKYMVSSSSMSARYGVVGDLAKLQAQQDAEDKKDTDIEIEGAGINIFKQSADEGNYAFILKLLNVYITHEKGSKSVNYLSNGDTVSTGGQTYHKYYRDWIIVIDDAKSHSDDKPSISIKYQTIVYTWNDLTDLYNANIDTNRITGDVQKQEYYNKYTPFLVQSNEDNGSMGALFYNFSSFNRDMMENYLISDATDLNLYSNSAFKNLSSVSVSADIISLDLGTSLIAGLAGFIQNDQSLAQSYNNTQVDSTSSVDSEGNEITSISQNFSLRNSESNIDTVAIGTAMSEVKDFAKVLQQLFVSGTVVTPGLGRIITILSLINIYVYISNRLDTVSGKYRVLSQVDEINGGKYTTTLSIMKALTLNGDTVYDVISSGNSNSEVVESTLSEYSAGDTTTSLFTNGVQKSMTKCYISLGVQGKVPKRQMLTRYTTDSKRKKFVADWAYIYVPQNLSGNVVFSAEMPDADTNGCKEVTLDWQCWYRSNLIAYNENLLQHLDTLDDVVQWSPLSGWKQQWDASGKSAVAKDIQRPLSLDAQGKTTGDYMYIIKFTTPLNFAGDYSSDGGYYVYAVFPVKLTMLSN